MASINRRQFSFAGRVGVCLGPASATVETVDRRRIALIVLFQQWSRRPTGFTCTIDDLRQDDVDDVIDLFARAGVTRPALRAMVRYYAANANISVGVKDLASGQLQPYWCNTAGKSVTFPPVSGDKMKLARRTADAAKLVILGAVGVNTKLQLNYPPSSYKLDHLTNASMLATICKALGVEEAQLKTNAAAVVQAGALLDRVPVIKFDLEMEHDDVRLRRLLPEDFLLENLLGDGDLQEYVPTKATITLGGADGVEGTASGREDGGVRKRAAEEEVRLRTDDNKRRAGDYSVTHTSQKTCQHPGCDLPGYQSVDGIEPYCVLHLPWRVEPKARRCKEGGCEKRAVPSTSGVTEYCAKHMAEHGLEPNARRCKEGGCEKRAVPSTSGVTECCLRAAASAVHGPCWAARCMPRTAGPRGLQRRARVSRKYAKVIQDALDWAELHVTRMDGAWLSSQPCDELLETVNEVLRVYGRAKELLEGSKKRMRPQPSSGGASNTTAARSARSDSYVPTMQPTAVLGPPAALTEAQSLPPPKKENQAGTSQPGDGGSVEGSQMPGDSVEMTHDS